MQFLRSIFRKPHRPDPVKWTEAPADVPIAVRPVTTRALAPERRVQRTPIGAWFDARNAVRANIPEAAYLRSRLERYRVTAPRGVTAPIPVIEIDDAGQLVTQYPQGDQHPIDAIFDPDHDFSGLHGPLAAETMFQRQARQAADAATARKLEEYEGDLRRIEPLLRGREEEIEALQAAKGAAVAARIAALDQEEIAAPVSAPPASTIALCRAFEVATIIGEAMNVCAALMNSAGIDPSNLAVEWSDGAAPAIIGWSCAAITLSALLFVITEWSFSRITAAMHDFADPTRAFRLATGSCAIIFVFTVLAALAAPRAQLGTAGHGSFFGWLTYLVIGMAPLVGAVLVHAHATRLEDARAEALRVVATPTPTALEEQLRTAHETTLVADRVRLRAWRDELMNAIQRLNRQMHGAEQAVHDIAHHEIQIVEVWRDSLQAAIARDRYHFHRFARLWGRATLLASHAPLTPAASVVPLRKRRVP